MNRRIAFPFRTLSESSVTASPWDVTCDGENWEEAPKFLSSWDYSRDVRVRREICVSFPDSAADLDIFETDLKLAVGTFIGTGRGKIPRRLVRRRVRIIDLKKPSVKVTVDVPGSILSDVLDIRTDIVLATAPKEKVELAPSRAGDRLWWDRYRVSLEGNEPRFPIEVADFGQLMGDLVARDAPSYLHWSTKNWDRDFHSAVRLFVNKNATQFVERLESEDKIQVQYLLADVMAQICERFLADVEVSDGDEVWEPSSLAAQAATWLATAWPGKEVDYIKSVLETEPGMFRACLLALAEQGDN